MNQKSIFHRYYVSILSSILNPLCSEFLELDNLSGFEFKMASFVEVSLTECNSGTIQKLPLLELILR